MKRRDFPQEMLAELTETSKELILSGKYNRGTKLEFVCNRHGVYVQAIGKHMGGQGCPKCGKEKSVECAAHARRKEHPLPDWFVNSLAEVHKEELRNGTYIRRGAKTFVCEKHGEYSMHHEVRLKGGMCPKCVDTIPDEILQQGLPTIPNTLPRNSIRLIRIQNQNKLPKDFLDDIKSSRDYKAFRNGLIGRGDKMVFVCAEHGEYVQNVACHISGQRCPKCKFVKQKMTFKQRKFSKGYNVDFLNALKDSPDEERFLNFQVNVEDKVLLTCPIHGKYRQSYKAFMQGHKCYQCGMQILGDKISETARNKNPFPQWFIDDLEGSPDKDDVLTRRLRTTDVARFYCEKHGLYEQTVGSHLRNGACCPKCFFGKHSSKLEESVVAWFEQNYPDVELLRNQRNYFGDGTQTELDIVFPQYKVAVEVDGLFWHSYEMLLSKGVDGAKNYHLKKTNSCNEHGYQLVHLFEDSLNNKFELCMDLIVSKLVLHGLKDEREKIYARKCRVEEIDKKKAIQFFEENHIQGYGDGTTIGLVYGGAVVSCMTFKRCAKNTIDAGSWCLTRYACKRGVFVVGGFERLLKNFVRSNDVFRIVSYSDTCVSDGSLYVRNGWKKCGTIAPDYMYVVEGVREHKFNYRLKRFREDENLYYEEGLTEFELAERNCLLRVYDCGKVKYEYIV